MSRLWVVWLSLARIVGTFLSRLPPITPLNPEEPFFIGSKLASYQQTRIESWATSAICFQRAGSLVLLASCVITEYMNEFSQSALFPKLKI